MGDFFQPTHLLIIGILLLVLFGAKRLPELGKGLGEGLKGFKEGIKGGPDTPPTPPAAQQSITPPQPPPPPPSTPVDPK
jgi:sec-independent protein translocase protein TatA